MADRSEWFETPCIRAGYMLWAPPPCDGGVSIEQLRIARTKRKKMLHIFLILRLMTSLWLKPLHKVADLIFSIEPINMFWGRHLHKPLIVALIFPFLHSRPWQLQSTPKILTMGRELCKVFKDS